MAIDAQSVAGQAHTPYRPWACIWVIGLVYCAKAFSLLSLFGLILTAMPDLYDVGALKFTILITLIGDFKLIPLFIRSKIALFLLKL